MNSSESPARVRPLLDLEARRGGHVLTFRLVERYRSADLSHNALAP